MLFYGIPDSYNVNTEASRFNPLRTEDHFSGSSCKNRVPTIRKYVMSESSQNTGTLWFSRHDFHYH